MTEARRRGRTKRFLAMVALLLFSLPAFAHRLDEYLQATILTIQPGEVHATLRMVPGVAVASKVIASIDSNHDGVLSPAEQQRYAGAVLADLRMEEDGRPLELQLGSVAFPAIAAMEAGTGEIEIAFSAQLPWTDGEHSLAFENHHQSGISVYLVNTLVPEDERLHLGTQFRNENQSSYRIVFTTAPNSSAPRATLSGFAGAFHLGVRHIAEGTDHLLFLLTLLLPAPLLAVAGRWARPAPTGRSLGQMARIVTAFTVGHSLTLALSVFGLVSLPSRPVEIAIAVSILISAAHALRPLFPGREAVLGAGFGLVHGLAFASALKELGVTGWYRVTSLLGFNLGIEAMQLAVVAVTLPALILLSRTRFYAMFRVTGAGFAGLASLVWIAERVLNRPTSAGDAITRVAQHGLSLALGLWGVCLAGLALQRMVPSRPAGQ